jgi:hypothetical protein
VPGEETTLRSEEKEPKPNGRPQTPERAVTATLQRQDGDGRRYAPAMVILPDPHADGSVRTTISYFDLKNPGEG